MRTPEPFRLEPTNGFITITAGYTPTVNIHEPDSLYCRYYWPPEIGPCSYEIFGVTVSHMDGDGSGRSGRTASSRSYRMAARTESVARTRERILQSA